MSNKYRVTVHRDISQCVTVEVQAENLEGAEEAAFEAACMSWNWKVDDSPASEPYLAAGVEGIQRL